jgi:hypothetical protein
MCTPRFLRLYVLITFFGVNTIIGLGRRDSSVGIEWVGFECRWGRNFPHIPRGPQPAVKWVTGIFPGREAKSLALPVMWTYITDERTEKFRTTDSVGIKL